MVLDLLSEILVARDGRILLCQVLTLLHKTRRTGVIQVRSVEHDQVCRPAPSPSLTLTLTLTLTELPPSLSPSLSPLPHLHQFSLFFLSRLETRPQTLLLNMKILFQRLVPKEP